MAAAAHPLPADTASTFSPTGIMRVQLMGDTYHRRRGGGSSKKVGKQFVQSPRYLELGTKSFGHVGCVRRKDYFSQVRC